MKTTVERIDDTTVKLSVTVEAERVDAAVEEAARHVAQEVKVPGFRPGKAPRKVLESRVGKDVILEHAAQDSVPGFFREAVQAEKIEVVGQPQFEVETFVDGQDATFAATVEVRPDVEVPDYQGMQIPHPEWEVDDDEIDEQLDTLRERFAELETVERPAQPGDHVVLSMSAEEDGEPLEDVREDDAMYQVNDPEESDQELDRQLIGAEAGSILSFADTLGDDYGEHAGKEVDIRVIVKEVKATQLPDLDDDFAVTASEFDTIEELRQAVGNQMRREKRQQAREALRSRVVETLAEQVEVTLPSSLVDQEVQFRIQRIAGQAQQYGLEFDQFLQMTGMDTEQLVEQLREQAEQTVKAQIVLDNLGEQADIDVNQEDLESEVRRQAERLDQDPAELAQFMTDPERLPALVADTFRRKTIDHLLASVQVLSAPPDSDDDLVDPDADLDEDVAEAVGDEGVAGDEDAADDRERGDPEGAAEPDGDDRTDASA